MKAQQITLDGDIVDQADIPPCAGCSGLVVSDDEGCLFCSICGQYTGMCDFGDEDEDR